MHALAVTGEVIFGIIAWVVIIAIIKANLWHRNEVEKMIQGASVKLVCPHCGVAGQVETQQMKHHRAMACHNCTVAWTVK